MADGVVTVPSAPDRKVVLLTGGSGQIGTAFCERYAATYEIVAVRHRRPMLVASQVQTFFDPFEPDGDGKGNPESKVFEITADLREESAVARVVEVTLARYGRIDAVVNTVGAFGRRSELLGRGLHEVTDLFKLNALVPTAVAVRVALDFWRHHDLENASHNRVVVNVSATAALDAADHSAGRVFGSTKAALNMLSLHLADELRPFNVRVAIVAPAPVPGIVTVERVVAAINSLIEGDETGRVLLLWDDGDELV